MARGEGAEQYAAGLLSVKPINAEIKTAKVRPGSGVFHLPGLIGMKRLLLLPQFNEGRKTEDNV